MTGAQMVEQFLRHRKVTEQFCAVMPDAQFGFKPWEGAQSFAALAIHLGMAGDFYLSFADGVPMNRPDPASLPGTPAEIRAYLAGKTAEQADRIGRLGDDLDRAVTMRNKEIPLGILLGQMREHEAHHKGQLMLMLRMCGVKDELFYALR